jgi:hypothetical protein
LPSCSPPAPITIPVASSPVSFALPLDDVDEDVELAMTCGAPSGGGGVGVPALSGRGLAALIVSIAVTGLLVRRLVVRRAS